MNHSECRIMNDFFSLLCIVRVFSNLAPIFFLLRLISCHSRTPPHISMWLQPHSASHRTFVQTFHSFVPLHLLFPLYKGILLLLCLTNPTHLSKLSYEDLQLLQNLLLIPFSVLRQLSPTPDYDYLLIYLPFSGIFEFKKDRDSIFQRMNEYPRLPNSARRFH